MSLVLYLVPSTMSANPTTPPPTIRKNSSKLAEDRDTIRALLLSAIKYDDYDIVRRDTIIRTPDMPIETMLSELRNRENSLQMKDETNNMGSDGTGSTRYSHQTPQTSTSGPYTSNTSGKRSSSPKKWSIPKFPDLW